MPPPFATEGALCDEFCAHALKPTRRNEPNWQAYPETAGFDILLVRETDGTQIGIEAKLVLNAKVVAQSLPYSENVHYNTEPGPDYRAVLVPARKCNEDVERICQALGVTVIQYYGLPGGACYSKNSFGPVIRPALPFEDGELDWGTRGWFEWAPAKRCPLPDYVPDVGAGRPAPHALTLWKIKAIKLCVLLEERPVTRADFRHLGLSPTMWLGPRGWLDRGEGGFVAGPRTPDLRRQHPRNFAEIEADKAKWAPKSILSSLVPPSAQPVERLL